MAVNVSKITHERLGRWEKRLVSSHATPALLLGIGHDHVSGQIVLCVTEEKTDAEIIAFLQMAISSLKSSTSYGTGL